MTGCGVTAVDTRSGYAVMGIVLFCFNSFFFFLRLANRATRMAQWGWDDTTIVIAWVCVLVLEFFERSRRDHWLTAIQLLTITFLVADPIGKAHASPLSGGPILITTDSVVQSSHSAWGSPTGP